MKKKFTHEKIETNNFLMIVLIFLVVSIAGIIEIIPLSKQKTLNEPIKNLRPYDALALEGRDIYIREGCVSCHSQMVRPFRAETLRYGKYSLASEFVYDRPFLWGSKRTGPDLARVGKRYSDAWHRIHLLNPREVVPESIMPSYPWLEDNMASVETIKRRMHALKIMGVPYSDDDIENAEAMLLNKTEMEALIYYLQTLGIHRK